MNHCHHEGITIGERTRELIPAHVDELVVDIRKNGLLQPVVVGDRDDRPLVDGLHRFCALVRLHTEGEIIFFDGEPIHPGCIPFVRFSDLDPKRLLEAEIAANIFRRELTWQERTDALAKLHKLQKSELGADATFLSTAAKLVGASGKNLNATSSAISRAVIIAEAMEANPELKNARSETEAFSRLKTDMTRLSSSLLGGAVGNTASLHTLLEGDFRKHFESFDAGIYDLILVDPPYGVGADTWTSKFLDSPHDYKDTWPHAKDIADSIFRQGHRITKPHSNLFMFCDISRWHELRDMADAAGWSMWPHPLIWHKSNEGIRPWGQKGPAFCYEAILFATKVKGMLRTCADVISDIYKVRDREHGAAKPPELYAHLVNTCSLPGDRILDPCCGSGTIFTAASMTKTIATGIEVNPHFAGLARKTLEDATNQKEVEQQSLVDLMDF